MKSVMQDGELIYPTKIICVGLNYVEHIREMNNQQPAETVFFMKPNSALSDQIYFNQEALIHFEGEITFLVKSGKLSAVGFGLDLTKREVQSRLRASGLPWERAKAFDHSAVFSAFTSYQGDLSELSMSLEINGVLTQQGGYDLMLNKPEGILKEINSFLTLEDGDLIMTGTPKGVGAINKGDTFTGKIFQKNTVIVEHSWIVQ